MTTALISIGNDLRRDDAVAATLCKRLPQRLLNRLIYVNLGIFGHQLATYIEDVDHVIIVDAVLDPSRVGQLLVFERLEFSSVWPAETHGMGWLTALKLMPKHPPITFVGVPVADLGWGSGLSPAVESNLNGLVKSLIEVCQMAVGPIYA